MYPVSPYENLKRVCSIPGAAQTLPAVLLPPKPSLHPTLWHLPPSYRFFSALTGRGQSCTRRKPKASRADVKGLSQEQPFPIRVKAGEALNHPKADSSAPRLPPHTDLTNKSSSLHLVSGLSGCSPHRKAAASAPATSPGGALQSWQGSYARPLLRPLPAQVLQPSPGLTQGF